MTILGFKTKVDPLDTFVFKLLSVYNCVWNSERGEERINFITTFICCYLFSANKLSNEISVSIFKRFTFFFFLNLYFKRLCVKVIFSVNNDKSV